LREFNVPAFVCFTTPLLGILSLPALANPVSLLRTHCEEPSDCLVVLLKLHRVFQWESRVRYADA
jgi:hypothetical protein